LTFPLSAAEQLDRAIDRVLAGDAPGGALDASLKPLADVAARLRTALVPVPPSAAFERRLGTRLARGGQPWSAGMQAMSHLVREQLRHPARLLVTGAVSSAALGVGVTAYAVWRGTRRSSVAQRLVHR
jgi:hypothetical protein